MSEEPQFVAPKTPNALEEVRALTLAAAQSTTTVPAHLLPKPATPPRVVVAAQPTLSPEEREMRFLGAGVALGAVGLSTVIMLYRLMKLAFSDDKK